MSESKDTKTLSDREKSVLEDNISLKAQLKELETTFNKMQGDFTRSIKMREKLDSLCKVLQKQTQEIKDESAAEIGKAEGQGNKLAKEVAENMEMMEKVNHQLNDIMNDGLKAKQENIELTKEVSEMKQKYDDKHEDITNKLKASSDELIKTKTELAQLRLKTAQEREEAYSEMHKLANLLVENRKQMKEAKDLELDLRHKLQGYEEKFTNLQTSLEETNTGYQEFTGEMDKMTKITKDLDEGTKDWQKKWETNNAELMDITKRHEQIQGEVARVHESLIKMTNLYAQLEREKSELLNKLGRGPQPSPTAPSTNKTDHDPAPKP